MTPEEEEILMWLAVIRLDYPEDDRAKIDAAIRVLEAA